MPANNSCTYHLWIEHRARFNTQLTKYRLNTDEQTAHRRQSPLFSINNTWWKTRDSSWSKPKYSYDIPIASIVSPLQFSIIGDKSCRDGFYLWQKKDYRSTHIRHCVWPIYMLDAQRSSMSHVSPYRLYIHNWGRCLHEYLQMVLKYRIQI